MKPERLAIYGDSGFTRIHSASRCTRERLTGLPQSYFPRAAKEGEHIICVNVDPNGTPYERGDILLGLHIQSKAYPDLRGDWEIVQARDVWTRRHDGSVSGWYRYLLVRAAKPADAAAARAAADERHRQIMDRAMNS